MAEAKGIKETQEMLLGVIALGFYLAKLAKDGIDVGDVSAFLAKLATDTVFAQKLQVAADGAGLITEEVLDISAMEALSMAMTVVPAVIAEIETLKMPAA